MDDDYRNPGPLQFEGPGSDAKAFTLCVEDQDYMGRIKKLQSYLDRVSQVASYKILKGTESQIPNLSYLIILYPIIVAILYFFGSQVKTIVKPGCSQDVLVAALSSMSSVIDVLSVMTAPSYSGQSYL